MYIKVEKLFCEYCFQIIKWEEVMLVLDVKNVFFIFFCGDGKCEDCMKELIICVDEQFDVFESQKVFIMGMKSLCIFFEQFEGVVVGEIECLNFECQCKV